MTAFLDAAVFMYAAGGQHPLKAPCAVILGRATAGSLDATTSAEVIQEIIHRYRSIGRDEIGIKIANETLNLFRPVLSISDSTVRRLPDLARRYSGLQARDLVHVATCLEEGITTIISPDRGFDSVSELVRLDPSQAAVG